MEYPFNGAIRTIGHVTGCIRDVGLVAAHMADLSTRDALDLSYCRALQRVACTHHVMASTLLLAYPALDTGNDGSLLRRLTHETMRYWEGGY